MYNWSRSSFFTVILISFLAACSVFADSWDPVDDTAANATVITITDAVQTNGLHTLDAADTTDWFKCVLTGGIPYQLESIGDSDTKAFMYDDENETTKLTEDDESGASHNFKIIYLPPTTETNFLKVQTFPIGSVAEYTLQYATYDHAPDGWDQADNVRDTATPLTMSASAEVHGPHVLDEFDYYDWFRFDLSAGVVYRF